MAFIKYLRDHWEGNLSLATSVLVNGVLLYLVLVVTLAIVGEAFQVPLYVGLPIFFAWVIWWCVGTIASALKNFRSADGSILRRGIAILAMIVVVVFVAFLANDLATLFLEQ